MEWFWKKILVSLGHALGNLCRTTPHPTCLLAALDRGDRRLSVVALRQAFRYFMAQTFVMGFYLQWTSTSLSNRDKGLIITLLQIFTRFKRQSSGRAVKLVPMRYKAWPEAMSRLTLILPIIIYSNKLDFLNFNFLASLLFVMLSFSVEF